MEDLIKALDILASYENPKRPFQCEHDILYVIISPSIVSAPDRESLAALGFFVDENADCFYSYRYGSA